MTRTEKYGALGYAALAVLIAIVTRHWKESSLLFAFGLPAVMYTLSVWFGRALAVRWDDQSQFNEIISVKPMIFRLLFGFLALIMVILAAAGYMNTHTVAEQTMNLSFFGLLSLLFLWGASYYRLRLNLLNRQYSLTQGFSPLVRTTSGSIDGSTLVTYTSSRGMNQVMFRPFGYKYGVPLICYPKSDEVLKEANWVADKLGIGVEQGGSR